MVVLLITRGHFFIDLVTGAIFADWIYTKVDFFLEKQWPKHHSEINDNNPAVATFPGTTEQPV